MFVPVWLPLQDDLEVIADLIGRLVSILLLLIAGYFFIRLLLAVFSGQIDLAAGKPGALADLVQELFFLLLSFVFALDAPRLARSFAALAKQNVASLTGNDVSALTVLMQPLLLLVFNILATLVVSVFLVNVVLSALRGQVAAMLGAPQSLSRSFSAVMLAVLALALGLALLRMGAWLMAFFL